MKNAVNWKALGVQLNFEESILGEMESSDDKTSMEIMLSEWLKRGGATRQILDEAIVKVISKGNLLTILESYIYMHYMYNTDKTSKRKKEQFQRVGML